MRYLFVDANHLASRVRFTSQSSLCRSTDGEPTGVLFGVLRNVGYVKSLFTMQAMQIVCFWDYGRAEERLSIFPGYKDRDSKKKKKLTEEELKQEEEDKRAYFRQIDLAIEALKMVGVRQVKVPGVEADDLISIYATMYAEFGDVLIYSGDKDLQQLVSDKIKIFDSAIVKCKKCGEVCRKKCSSCDKTRPEPIVLGRDELCRLWGLSSPNLFLMHKAVDGDDSDMIPGVPGVGEKSAPLIAEHQDLVFSLGGQPEGMEKKTWAAIEKARANIDTIVRNIKLMKLPRSWQDSYYGEWEAKQAIEQLRDPSVRRDIDSYCTF